MQCQCQGTQVPSRLVFFLYYIFLSLVSNFPNFLLFEYPLVNLNKQINKYNDHVTQTHFLRKNSPWT